MQARPGLQAEQPEAPLAGWEKWSNPRSWPSSARTLQQPAWRTSPWQARPESRWEWMGLAVPRLSAHPPLADP
eukprot:12774660-Alexandrium_andersonii.AAC.1